MPLSSWLPESERSEELLEILGRLLPAELRAILIAGELHFEHEGLRLTIDALSDRIARDRDLDYDFALGDEDPTGDYLLTFIPRNYATACKTCNSIMKGSYFPISGERGAPSSRVEDYRPEEPYVLLPIGHRGHNPEVVLRFNGVVAVPRYRTGHRHRIARVMIDLFGFNEREELLYERARTITYLYLAHAHATTEDGPLVEEGRRAVDALVSDAAAHSNCARCYKRLLEEDEGGAREIFEAAWGYVEGV